MRRGNTIKRDSFEKDSVSGVFTPEQYNDKTTTRQMLNLCIPIAGIPPGKSDASGGIWPKNLMLK